MATGPAEAPDCNAEASSTEVMELIPGKIKATYIRDIYIKSDTEQNFFCNVIHLTCLDENRIVVVDDAMSKPNPFGFSEPEDGTYKFRVKLIDTGRNQVMSVLDVRGQFTSMSNTSSTQLALCVNGSNILLLRADKTLTAERPLKLSNQSDIKITHLSTYKEDLYICSEGKISKVDMMGKTTQVFESTIIPDPVASQRSRRPFRQYRDWQYYISSAMYTDGNNTFLYAITDVEKQRFGRLNQPYLAHGTGTKGVMDKITTLVPGEPRSIVMDDEFELLFVLIYDDDNRDHEEHYVIYALRPVGTGDGGVLLCEADGLQDVTSMAYCSKTRQLYVGCKENNYVKVYQLSSVP